MKSVVFDWKTRTDQSLLGCSWKTGSTSGAELDQTGQDPDHPGQPQSDPEDPLSIFAVEDNAFVPFSCDCVQDLGFGSTLAASCSNGSNGSNASS